MPLLCVQMTWTCSIDTFLFNVSERGEPPVGGIRILVQDDYEVIAFPDVGQPEVRVEHGGAKRNESKELVVPVSQVFTGIWRVGRGGWDSGERRTTGDPKGAMDTCYPGGTRGAHGPGQDTRPAETNSMVSRYGANG